MPHLDCWSNLFGIISNVLLSSSFEWDFGTNNTHEDTDFILCLIDLVTTPTEKENNLFIKFKLKFCSFP